MSTPAEIMRQARTLKASGVPTRKLAVLSSFTAGFLEPSLVVESHGLGFALSPWFGPFNQFEQLVLSPASELWAQQPDALWIAMRVEDVDPRLASELPALDAKAAAERVGRVRARLVSVVKAAREKTKAPILVSNFAPPSAVLGGLFDAGAPGSLPSLLLAENAALARELDGIASAHVFDWAGVVAAVGAERFTDPRLWHLGRVVCAAAHQPRLARAVARSAAAVSLAALEGVVLDLDNTLWGGVLGDDGVGGLVLGDDHPGSVFKQFQLALLGLRSRGFLLAIASKNERATVLEALASHPEMVLRQEHFAAIEASWDPKPLALQRIAQQLNLGVDSLLFVDDNPVERATVRAALPQVQVVELPADPLGYLDALKDVPGLDRPKLLAEDKRRAEMYREDEAREALEATASDVGEFLTKLKMVAQVGLAGPSTLERIHQLINKTNQFNLTTRRYELDEVKRVAASPEGRVAWLRLSDAYGDLGLVCVGILKRASGTRWEIDTLLMSCRVMGRQVEDAFLAYLGGLVREAGGTELLGVYRPTPKSTPVKDFYDVRGFTVLAQSSAETSYLRALSPDWPAWPQVIERVEVKGP
ncbi:MAG: HAD-IIIC family phosphatase [Myxococcaceae bacterium]|nr:HAD-IIIC family phosphatase [Myxococcaceae bacterium]